MSQYLLAITPQLHEERAKKIRGSLNKATGLLLAIVLVPAVCWALHYVQVIPALFKRDLPPPIVAAIGAVDGSIDGATGFMVDASHFLTTERALKGDGGVAIEGDTVSISFSTEGDETQEPIEGVVAWLSEPMSGSRLVLVQMPENRPDMITISDTALKDGTRLRAAGFQLNPETGDPILTKLSFQLTVFEDSLGNAEWGDNVETPTFEGAPVLEKVEDSFVATGILTQGTLVLKLPYEALREAGVEL